MSKRAEQKALEAYPYNRAYTDNDVEYDGNFCNRLPYIEGYEQAEKDLALTWEDIQRIVTFADLLMTKERMQDEFHKQFISPEAYYTEVLNRFNKSKEGK